MSTGSILFFFITSYFIFSYLNTGKKSVLGMLLSASLVFFILLVNSIMDNVFPNSARFIVVLLGVAFAGGLLSSYIWADDLDI